MVALMTTDIAASAKKMPRTKRSLRLREGLPSSSRSSPPAALLNQLPKCSSVAP